MPHPPLALALIFTNALASNLYVTCGASVGAVELFQILRA